MKVDTKPDGKPAPKRRRGRPRVLNQDENTAEVGQNISEPVERTS